MRDYFLLSLLTGARRANMLAMRWANVNFDRAEWRIQRTKKWASNKSIASSSGSTPYLRW